MLILLAVLVVLALVSARTLLSYWVDLLWFNSLGYNQVFWKTTGLQVELFALFLVLTFAILYGARIATTCPRATRC